MSDRSIWTDIAVFALAAFFGLGLTYAIHFEEQRIDQAAQRVQEARRDAAVEQRICAARLGYAETRAESLAVLNETPLVYARARFRYATPYDLPTQVGCFRVFALDTIPP